MEVHNRMKQWTIRFGVFLVLVGLVMYFGKASTMTALLPSLAGVGLLLSAFLANRPRWRMVAAYLPLFIAGLLIGAALRGFTSIVGGDVTSTALVQVLLAVLSTLYMTPLLRGWLQSRRHQGMNTGAA